MSERGRRAQPAEACEEKFRTISDSLARFFSGAPLLTLSSDHAHCRHAIALRLAIHYSPLQFTERLRTATTATPTTRILPSWASHRACVAHYSSLMAAPAAAAAARGVATWRQLAPSADLSLVHTLLNGQCFNWCGSTSSNNFAGVMGSDVVLLREEGGVVQFASPTAADPQLLQASLRSLFQLDAPLHAMRAEWSAADARLAAVAAVLPAMRILRQDPVECLMSFITSSCNNIGRITQLLTKLRHSLGARVGSAEGVGELHAFPTVDALAACEEQSLRDIGFGYRAKYIRGAARQVQAAGGAAWLHSLRGRPSADVQAALVALDGCGKKVADCVALFSLDVTGAIPVDTHVWSIAATHFDPTLREVKSLTPAVYDRVGDLFRTRFGSHAGWAHSLLFAAELPLFRPFLPPAMVEEDRLNKGREKAAKSEKKLAAAARKAAAAKPGGASSVSDGGKTAAAAAAAAAAAVNSAEAAPSTMQQQLPAPAAPSRKRGRRPVPAAGEESSAAAATGATTASASEPAMSIAKRSKQRRR